MKHGSRAGTEPIEPDFVYVCAKNAEPRNVYVESSWQARPQAVARERTKSPIVMKLP